MSTPFENQPADDTLDINPRFYRKLADAISGLRERLQAQYERRFPGQDALIRTAIEEAESVAWCTAFPQLFFPDLAEVQMARVLPNA
jgi:hypothetical protein